MFTLFLAVQIICCTAAFITCGMAYNMFYFKEKPSEYSVYKISFEKNIEELESLSRNTYKDENGNTYCLPEGNDDTSDPSMRIYQIEHKGVVPISEMREKIGVFMNQLDQYHIAKIDLFLFPDKVTGVDENQKTFFTLFPDENMNKKSNIDKIYLQSNDKIIIAPTSEDGYLIGNYYKINEYDYKCVAERKGIPFIPYNAIDDNFCVYLIYISFEDMITQNDINNLTPVFNSVFGENIKESFPPDPYDPIDMQLNQMIYTISIGVMMIILLAIAKFYSFILSDRKKTLSILRLCGCSRSKVHLVYMIEIFFTMALTSTAGCLIFKYAFFKGISDMYPSFIDFYTKPVYFIILVVYILLAMIIMAVTVIPSTRVSITDMKRNA